MNDPSLPQRSGRRLDVEGVWKAYGGQPFVVRDVTFVLEPGEFLTLLGPSGSGKTTILLLIAGFETLSRGNIRVDGRDIVGQLAGPSGNGHAGALDPAARPSARTIKSRCKRAPTRHPASCHSLNLAVTSARLAAHHPSSLI